MNELLEIVVALFQTLFYVLEGIFFFFVPRHKKQIKGQIVLVTGSGSGIGKLLALRFAKLGGILVLVDINEAGNEKTASEVKKLGVRCYTIRCDLSKKEQIKETVDRVKKEVGDVDILVNNAGIVSGRSLLELTDGQIEKTFEVNVMAHFWLVRGFLPSMLSRNQGHIVNIVSVAGFFALNKLSDYCSSKFAALGFNDAVAEELRASKKTGVKVTCVCPYFINTGMFDGVSLKFTGILPMLEPEYVADKAMEAVLTDQKLVMLPKIMYFFPIIKTVFPLKVTELVFKVLQVDKDMDTFKGRSK